ncbi:MAG: gliding motility protein GldC [Cytophagales bacterium]|nr:gliding motility protein GldC [Cytophagales bacterium]
MSTSEIKLIVDLDENHLPEKIMWDADDKELPGPQETKSFSLSMWDHKAKNTMRIDLWSKDMPVDEMKRFYIDCLGGLSQSILNATGDEHMSSKLNELCEEFVTHLKNGN